MYMFRFQPGILDLASDAESSVANCPSSRLWQLEAGYSGRCHVRDVFSGFIQGSFVRNASGSSRRLCAQIAIKRRTQRALQGADTSAPSSSKLTVTLG